MTLKQLYEEFTADEIKNWIGEYLIKPAEYRHKYFFENYLEDLWVCPICGEINERDNMTYHVWDIGNAEELICESCRNDEEV